MLTDPEHGWIPTLLVPAIDLAPRVRRQRRQISLVVRERDGSTVVDSYIFGTRQNSRWHLTLTAAGAASRHVVEFHDRADRQRFMRSRVVFGGVDDARLRMVAAGKDSGRCLVSFDPQNVTTEAPLTLRGLSKLNPYRA